MRERVWCPGWLARAVNVAGASQYNVQGDRYLMSMTVLLLICNDAFAPIPGHSSTR